MLQLIFQPVVGWLTDKKHLPHTLSVGMGLTFAGLLALALANNYPLILISACVIGLGSAIFHPEASRVAHMAAGARRAPSSRWAWAPRAPGRWRPPRARRWT